MAIPMVRGRRWVPPMSGMMPSWTSGMAKTVPSAAMRISQQSASSMPAPMQTRWMAAMTGTRTRSMRVKHSCRWARWWRIRGSAAPAEPSRAAPSVEPALTSRPEQNAPPAPWRMTTRTPGALSTASAASRIPSQTSRSRAFSLSGLFSMMVATGALISTCTLLVITPPVTSPNLRIPLPLEGRGQGEGCLPCRLAVELLHQRGQSRIAQIGLVGLIERGAVEEPLVALHDLVVQLVIGRRHRVGVEHLVGDELGHGFPVAFHALLVELGRQPAPAVDVEDGLVGARGGVEGDLLLDHQLLVASLLLGVAHDDEAGRGVGEVLARAARLLQSRLDGRVHDLPEVLRAVEGMHVHPVAELPGHPAHVGVHGGDVDGHVRVIDGTRIEERRHDVEGVELPLEVELGTVLPAVPDGADGADGLGHLGAGRFELDGEAPLVVRLDLGAQPEHEPPARSLLEIPGDHGRDHRAAREDRGDIRAELDALGDGGGHGQGQKRVVLGLRGPEAVIAHGLDLAGIVGQRLEVVAEHADIELHGRSPCLIAEWRGSRSIRESGRAFNRAPMERRL